MAVDNDGARGESRRSHYANMPELVANHREIFMPEPALHIIGESD